MPSSSTTTKPAPSTNAPIAAPSKAQEGTTHFSRARKVFLVLGIAYAAAVVLLAVPFFQLHAVYLHAIKWPLFAQYDLPEKYGLAPGTTLNFYIDTPDNVTLGAWFVVNHQHHRSRLASSSDPLPALTVSNINLALSERPTILYLHGNAATRAVPFRVAQCQAFASRLNANVLVVDYRGFGDSTGSPSERGLVTDARAAWDWLVREHGAKAEDVVLVGHSLGTAVASQLAVELAKEGVSPRGVALLAPFSSIRTLLDTYHILGLVPLLKPLAMIPGATGLYKRYLTHHFDTFSVITNITAPLLLAHAEDDYDIPYSHSDALFSPFLEPHLPALPELTHASGSSPVSQLEHSEGQWISFVQALEMRRARKAELVRAYGSERFGVVEEFVRDPTAQGEGKGNVVVHARTRWGGHDRIGLQEGVQDLIALSFGFI